MDRIFKNRHEAAIQLAAVLRSYKNKDAVVLAIPRGGVPIGAVIADELKLPMDIALSKKIGHPVYKEFAIGAVSLNESIVDLTLGVPEAYLEVQIPRLQLALRERYRTLKGIIKPLDLTGKIVIITDDGIATGHTMSATIKMIKRQDIKEIVVAVPIISPGAAVLLQKECDKLIALKTPPHFRSVGQFYTDFDQVTDAEVMELLKIPKNN